MQDPEDTRTRLLQTALSVFAQRDFDAVSVREIVERAGVNIAAVSYHFGGKQGLYLATAEYLADVMQQRVQPAMQKQAQSAENMSPDVAAEHLEALIDTLLHTLLGDPLGDDAAGFILREQLQPTAAFDVLFDRLMQPIQMTFQALFLHLHPDRVVNGYEQILLTHALMGQILAFRTARETLLRRLGKAQLSRRDIDAIAKQVLKLTLNAIDNTQNRGQHK
jgi:AcrR family transcriptional regulator